MSPQKPNIDDVYKVLRVWAAAQQIHTYTELSGAYQARTNDWFEPHLSWDAPLGELNQRLYDAIGAPALSALVALKTEQEPGGSFWGCAPNVPARPATDIARLAEWARIVKDVHAYSWPVALP
jgi:hypothetical protein